MLVSRMLARADAAACSMVGTTNNNNNRCAKILRACVALTVAQLQLNRAAHTLSRPRVVRLHKE